MSPLRQALEDYLALRQALGCKLSEARTRLPQFVEFLERQGHTFITTEWAVCWATHPQHVQPAEWARRLRWVRRFARYHSALDSRTEVPPWIRISNGILPPPRGLRRVAAAARRCVP